MPIEYPVLGIDFGTTYTCGFVYVNSRFEPIMVDGKTHLPSFFSIHDGIEVVGAKAKNQISDYPESTIYDIKRFIGKSYSECTALKEIFKYTFEICPDQEDKTIYELEEKDGSITGIYPDYVISSIYKKLKNTAETTYKIDFQYAVITIPAYFDEEQKALICSAAEQAGLSILEIIPEPVAAALAYGIPTFINDTTVVVYDFGGGTFDICIMRTNISGFDVICTDGIPNLGGRDFDQIISNIFKRKAQSKYKVSDKELIEYSNELITKAEECKIYLSKNDVGSIPFTYKGKAEIYIHRSDFEEALKDEIQKTCDLVKSALKKAKIDTLGVTDYIALVGGSSYIPLVYKMLKDQFPKTHILNKGHYNTVVGKGACMKAIQKYCIDKKQGCPLLLPYIHPFLTHDISLCINNDLERTVLCHGSKTGIVQSIKYTASTTLNNCSFTIKSNKSEIVQWTLNLKKNQSIVIKIVVTDDGVFHYSYHLEGTAHPIVGQLDYKHKMSQDRAKKLYVLPKSNNKSESPMKCRLLGLKNRLSFIDEDELLDMSNSSFGSYISKQLENISTFIDNYDDTIPFKWTIEDISMYEYFVFEVYDRFKNTRDEATFKQVFDMCKLCMDCITDPRILNYIEKNNNDNVTFTVFKHDVEKLLDIWLKYAKEGSFTPIQSILCELRLQILAWLYGSKCDTIIGYMINIFHSRMDISYEKNSEETIRNDKSRLKDWYEKYNQ